VCLQLCHVVSDVVHLPGSLCGAAVNRRGHRLTNPVGHRLPVCPGEVRGAVHRCQICLPLRRRERRTGELAIREDDSVAVEHCVHPFNVVRADLMTQAARAGVDQHGDLALAQAECTCGVRVEDPLDHLHLDEVVTRSHRSQLPRPRVRARSETAAGSAPGRRPPDSVRSRSSAVPIPCRSTMDPAPSRST